MRRYHIALLPGDGIGPEVMDASLGVLDAASVSGVAGTERSGAPAAGTGASPSLSPSHRSDGLHLDLVRHAAGAEHYRRTGDVLPRDVLDDCLRADAVLLAAIGLPDVRLPDNTEVQPEMMVGLRRALDLYAAVRPIRLYRGAPTPLGDTSRGIDFVIIRENLEGLFASYGGGCLVGDQVATDTLVVTRAGTERVVEFAFRLAARRQGRPLDGRRLVTCVDKANVFRSLAFFRKVFFEVAARHPAVAAEAVYVDAMSLYMLQTPQAFDVLVMENQFGDILSDLGAGLVGGLGLAPSAELGDEHGLFQPSHGTAPQLAGKDTANPLAMILSAAMMLDWLGERHHDPAATEAARRIEAAVEHVLAEGHALTPDLGGTAGTRAVGDAVARALASTSPASTACGGGASSS